LTSVSCKVAPTQYFLYIISANFLLFRYPFLSFFDTSCFFDEFQRVIDKFQCVADTCLYVADTCQCVVDTCQCVVDTCQCVIDTCQCVVDTCQCVVDTCQYVVDTCQCVADTCQCVVDTCQRIVDTCQCVVDTCQRVVDTCRRIAEGCQSFLEGCQNEWFLKIWVFKGVLRTFCNFFCPCICLCDPFFFFVSIHKFVKNFDSKPCCVNNGGWNNYLLRRMLFLWKSLEGDMLVW